MTELAPIQRREFLTNTGLTIPYYRVPYTEAYLDEFNGFGQRKLLDFGWLGGRPDLPEPLLSDMRWIFDRIVDGYNTENAMRGLLGRANLLSPDESEPHPEFYVDISSLSQMEWQNRGSFEIMVNSANVSSTIAPFTSYGRTAMVQPRPQNAVSYPIYGTWTAPTTYVYTSDGAFRGIDFQVFSASAGYQSIDFRGVGYRPYDSRLHYGMEDDFANRLVEEQNRDEEDEGDMARYSPRIGTRNVGCYIMNKFDVTNFLRDLWNTSIMEDFKQNIMGQSADAILGLRWFYGIANIMPQRDNDYYISVGNVTFTELDKVPVPSAEFITYDFGSISVPAYYGDYRDFSAVDYKMYLPFVGMIDLNPSDVVNQTLYLRYHINLTDGSAVCKLSTTSSFPDSQGLIFNSSCQWGYDIPIKVDATASSLGAIVRLIPMAQTVANAFGDTASYTAGSLEPNANVMGDFTAKLICHRKGDVTAGLDEAMGQPAAARVTVGNASGYLKAQTVYNGGSLSMRRADEIVQQLIEGIYI